MTKTAVYTGSQNIYDDMVVSAKSLIANSDVDKVYFLIEDDVFPYELCDLIETINVSDQTYYPKDGPNMKTRFTYFAMMRAALAKVFPNHDKILSLDCDTICIKSVSELWNFPIDDYYFAASKEPHRSIAGMLYTNVGVALMNLKKLRETKKVDECIDVLNRQKYDYVDQDVMNYLCQGYIYDLPSVYNTNDWTIPNSQPSILHFAGVKRDSWHRHPQAEKYNNLSWGEIMSIRKQTLLYPE